MAGEFVHRFFGDQRIVIGFNGTQAEVVQCFGLFGWLVGPPSVCIGQCQAAPSDRNCRAL